MKNIAVVLALAILLVAVAWVGQTRVIVRRAEREVLLMDTFVRLVVHGRQSQAALDDIIDATVKEMARLESVLSAHAAGSDVDKLNTAATAPRVVSDETIAVLERAKQVYERSQGAFDVTIGALMRAWGFGTDARAVPTPAALAEALPGVGFEHVEMDVSQRTVRLTHPNTQLDLGGVAKGYIVDQAILFLAQRGITNAFVEAGGDVRVLGGFPGQFIWEKPRAVRIGVQHPTQPDALIAVVSTYGGAVLTSGDYERYFIQDGVRYTHIVDPRTGMTVRGIASATIVAPEAALADAIATAAMVLNVEQGIALIESFPGVMGLLVTEDGTVVMSQGMSAITELTGR
ncbi:MAG: FAD:protein FMN transferase [Selenomonadales bacterium]|nr:FAD:protein FMN transferase [Selenomonadales bacterium]